MRTELPLGGRVVLQAKLSTRSFWDGYKNAQRH
jgi:hypothetical protein